MNHLPNALRKKLKAIEDIIPNKLRNNEFNPSDPETHLTLKELGYTQESLIWAD